MPELIRPSQSRTPARGGPTKCLTHGTTEKDPRQGSPLSAWTGGDTEKDWSERPSDHQLQEAWKKTLIGPWLLLQRQSMSCTLGATSVSASKAAAHAQLSRGQSCHRQKKSCAYAHWVTSVVFDYLRPCGLWPARLLCQGRGASPGKNTGAYWPIPSRALYFHCCSHQLPWEPGAARNPVTQAAAPPPHLALTGANPVFQGSLRSKPQWTTHMQRWK